MKKTYITPAMVVATMAEIQIAAISIDINNSGTLPPDAAEVKESWNDIWD